MEINFFHEPPAWRSPTKCSFFQAHACARPRLRHDMHATFMAKPIAGEPGSAMHIHQSVRREGQRPEHLQQPRRHRRGREFGLGISVACNATPPPRPPCSPPYVNKLPPPHPLHGRRRSTSSGAPTTAPSGSVQACCRTGPPRRVENRGDRRPTQIRISRMAATLACGLARHPAAGSSPDRSAWATPILRRLRACRAALGEAARGVCAAKPDLREILGARVSSPFYTEGEGYRARRVS